MEKYFEGRKLTWLELRNPIILKKLIEMICDINYDKELAEVVKKSTVPEVNFAKDLTANKVKGWFHKYMTEMRPLLLMADLLGKYPRA